MSWYPLAAASIIAVCPDLGKEIKWIKVNKSKNKSTNVIYICLNIRMTFMLYEKFDSVDVIIIRCSNKRSPSVLNRTIRTKIMDIFFYLYKTANPKIGTLKYGVREGSVGGYFLFLTNFIDSIMKSYVVLESQTTG